MAHSRTARKNVRKNATRRERNKDAQSMLRTKLKRIRASTAGGDTAAALAQLPGTMKLLDKSAKLNLSAIGAAFSALCST